MRGFQRSGQLNSGSQRQVERHRTLDLRSFYVLHHKVVGADVVDLADVRMIQRCDSPRLALKPLAEFLRRSFDRDNSVQPRIASLPHLAHPSRADRRKNFVWAEFIADREGHATESAKCTRSGSWA